MEGERQRVRKRARKRGREGGREADCNITSGQTPKLINIINIMITTTVTVMCLLCLRDHHYNDRSDTVTLKCIGHLLIISAARNEKQRSLQIIVSCQHFQTSNELMMH